MSQKTVGRNVTMMKKFLLFAMGTVMVIGPLASQAQTKTESGDEHSGHTMQHGTTTPDKGSGNAHAGHTMPPGATMPKKDSGTTTMPGMRHDAMQGGSAPPDARDPHAYSGGYTLGSGPYVLPGPRQIRMADEKSMGSLLFDRLEAVHTSNKDVASYDLKAWYGRDYNRLVLKAEGEVDDGKLEEASTEVLWGHAITAYWDTQLGVRFDSGEGPSRTWLAFGVEGLAPYWFDVSATAYAGNDGRTALNVEAEYELLFTQKLILQPRLELNAYGKRDAARELGSGLSDLSLGVRLRYEIRREFAPYVGVEWARKFGETADFARAAGKDASETRVVAGLRFWF